jgi:hypothetical protein
MDDLDINMSDTLTKYFHKLVYVQLMAYVHQHTVKRAYIESILRVTCEISDNRAVASKRNAKPNP